MPLPIQLNLNRIEFYVILSSFNQCTMSSIKQPLQLPYASMFGARIRCRYVHGTLQPDYRLK